MVLGSRRFSSFACRWSPWYLVWCLAAVAATVAACGGNTAQSPTPVSAPADVPSVSATLTPVTLRPAPAAAPSRASFALLGSVTFRDEGGTGFRVESLEIDLVDEDGPVERLTFGLDLLIEPGGTAVYPLPDSVSLPMGRKPIRLRVRGAGTDRSGRRRMTTAGEAPLEVAETPVFSPAAAGGEVTFVGAGDIADCALPAAQATARLLDGIPGEVFTLGDHTYPSGEREFFRTCYDPSWGRHKARTYPVLGNHDWGVEYGAPYFEYFGGRAGPRSGWYSFELGAWHVLVLNSNTSLSPNGAQYAWAKADLAAHPSRCTLAMWHHPRFSSGPNGNTPEMQPFWSLLNNAGVDLVLSGHEHMYERFAKQDHEGVPTPRGMRQFVVGTGGTRLAGTQAARPNSEARGFAWGVLKLSLRPDDYSWEFVSVPGSSFRDAGTDTCR
jgi:hypothetical protein